MGEEKALDPLVGGSRRVARSKIILPALIVVNIILFCAIAVLAVNRFGVQDLEVKTDLIRPGSRFPTAIGADGPLSNITTKTKSEFIAYVFLMDSAGRNSSEYAAQVAKAWDETTEGPILVVIVRLEDRAPLLEERVAGVEHIVFLGNIEGALRQKVGVRNAASIIVRAKSMVVVEAHNYVINPYALCDEIRRLTITEKR